MKILIVSPFFPPRNVVASWRAYSWASAWRTRGHEVSVLTALESPNSESIIVEGLAGLEVLRAERGRVFETARERFKAQTRAGTPSIAPSLLDRLTSKVIVSFKEYLQSVGILASVRWPDLWFFWMRNALPLVRDRQFDIVVSTFGPVSSLLIGRALKRNGQARMFVADFRDLWTGNPSYRGIFLFRPIEWALEASVLRAADVITTVSEPLAAKIRYLAPGKTVAVISNGHEPAVLRDRFSGTENELGTVLISYTGTVYLPYQTPRSLFAVLSKLKNKFDRIVQVRFYGPNTEVLRPLISEFGLENMISLHGLVSREEALQIQADSSALLFLESTETPGREGIVTGKIFEYFAAKRPILAIGVSKTSIVGKLIDETSSGVCVGQDETLIEKCLESLLNNEAMGVAPQGLPSRFDRRQIALDFLSLIESEFEARKNATAK